jgi:hypothetical protein
MDCGSHSIFCAVQVKNQCPHNAWAYQRICLFIFYDGKKGAFLALMSRSEIEINIIF